MFDVELDGERPNRRFFFFSLISTSAEEDWVRAMISIIHVAISHRKYRSIVSKRGKV